MIGRNGVHTVPHHSSGKGIGQLNRMLTMASVRKTFGAVDALSNLTFEVERGEIFGFLGPSGAGKTTTIKLLTRQLIPEEGEITVFGRDISTFSLDDYHRIGILTDNSGLYERLSVWDNLAVFARIKGLPKGAVEDAIAEVGLSEEKNKKAKQLSKGMKQRVILARAILHKPELLFLDEPTSALDPGNTLSIHKLLQKLNREGTTIFLTTHNMEEADKLCTRVAFLNQGHIVELGTPNALKRKHASGKIVAELEGGARVEAEQSAAGLRSIADQLEGRTLERVYSQEPNLEQIFLKVTGRDLA
jgi:ABC-2 type transport system ATP-binding protein